MKRRKAVANHAKIQGKKYAKMACLIKYLYRSVLNDITTSLIAWTAVPTIQCVFSYAMHAVDNTQLLIKVFNEK